MTRLLNEVSRLQAAIDSAYKDPRRVDARGLDHPKLYVGCKC